MDPFIDVVRTRARLSAVRHDTASRSAYLSPLHRTGAPAACLCTDSPIQMGVARRTDPVLTYYLYHLHRNDSQLHHPECPHRTETGLEDQRSSQDQASPTSIHTSDTHLSSIVCHTPLLEPVQPYSNNQRNRLTGLDALLDTLLLTSGLNVWHPGFRHHRGYFQSRFRLIEASKRIRPFGSSTLADVLYFPPIWDPSKRDDIEFDLAMFFQQLSASDGIGVPRGVVVGRVKDFYPGSNARSPRIRLAESRLHLNLDACPSLPVIAPAHLHFHLVMLAVELLPPASLRVIDAACSLMTNQWVPVASTDHAELVDALVHEERSFIAPLRGDESTCRAYPDILVTHRSGPHILTKPLARASAHHTD